MAEKIYVVAPGRSVWSIKWDKTFQEGEEIDLSHASDEDIQLVFASGAIIPLGPLKGMTGIVEKSKEIKKQKDNEVTNG